METFAEKMTSKKVNRDHKGQIHNENYCGMMHNWSKETYYSIFNSEHITSSFLIHTELCPREFLYVFLLELYFNISFNLKMY
jgi:hypothetical protein